MVRPRSRGQTILIMSILFAVTVLTTVVLLNTLHAPANVNAELQASSLDDIEQTEAQIADDMERLFLVHTSMNPTGPNERLPYINETSGPDAPFGKVVSNYSDLSGSLTASESGAVVNASYNESRSQEGVLVRQTEDPSDDARPFTNDGNPDWTVLAGADGIPRLSMNVTQAPTDPDRPFKIVVDGDTELTFDGDGVEGSGIDCEREYPIQVDTTDGVGTVSKGGEVCGRFDLGRPTDLTFENGSEVTGTYTISGADPQMGDATTDLTSTSDWRKVYDDDDVIVNPAFDVQYRDPSITHESTFHLYNETSP